MAHPTGFRPAQPRLIQVKRITDLSPHLRCITFHSDTLHNYPAVGRHAAHTKLFLARPVQKAPTLPTLGERGPQWPEGEARLDVRTYTILCIPAQIGRSGCCLCAARPRRTRRHVCPQRTARRQRRHYSTGWSAPNAACVQHLLSGRRSLFVDRHCGAARRAAPHATGHAVIRIDSEADRLLLAAPTGLSVHWVVGSTASTDTLLQQFHAVTRDIDASSAFFCLADEDRIVVQLRRYVRRELKVERNQLYAV